MTDNRNRRLFAMLAVVASVLASSSSAVAFHIPATTYTGTHSGGGTLAFDVSADGSTITRFRVENYSGPFCTVTFVEQTGNIPIINHSFSGGGSFLGISYSGSFTGVQSAQGSFSDFDCASGTLSWSARTSASPAGSEECKNAQAPVAQAQTQVEKAKRAVEKAKRAVEKATKAVRRADAPSAKKRARKKRTEAKRELQQAKTKRTTAETELQQAQAAQKAVCEPS